MTSISWTQILLLLCCWSIRKIPRNFVHRSTILFDAEQCYLMQWNFILHREFHCIRETKLRGHFKGWSRRAQSDVEGILPNIGLISRMTHVIWCGAILFHTERPYFMQKKLYLMQINFFFFRPSGPRYTLQWELHMTQLLAKSFQFFCWYASQANPLCHWVLAWSHAAFATESSL